MANKQQRKTSKMPGDRSKNTASENRSVGEMKHTSPKEDRMADLGGSGQFAPGGYYNQQAATKPDRIDLDEELAPRRHRH